MSWVMLGVYAICLGIQSAVFIRLFRKQHASHIRVMDEAFEEYKASVNRIGDEYKKALANEEHLFHQSMTGQAMKALDLLEQIKKISGL